MKKRNFKKRERGTESRLCPSLTRRVTKNQHLTRFGVLRSWVGRTEQTLQLPELRTQVEMSLIV